MNAKQLVSMLTRRLSVSQTMSPEEARAQAKTGPVSDADIAKAFDEYVDERIAKALKAKG